MTIVNVKMCLNSDMKTTQNKSILSSIKWDINS